MLKKHSAPNCTSTNPFFGDFAACPRIFAIHQYFLMKGLLADVPLERYVLPCVTNTKPQTQKHTNTEKQREKGKNTKCTNTKRHLFNDHEKS